MAVAEVYLRCDPLVAASNHRAVEPWRRLPEIQLRVRPCPSAVILTTMHILGSGGDVSLATWLPEPPPGAARCHL
jgi:hypothetical protein